MSILFYIYIFLIDVLARFFRHKYTNYDASLNVVRVEDLLDEVLAVYRPLGDYVFFSIDVVSMFNVISMDDVCDILAKHVDKRFSLAFQGYGEFAAEVNPIVLQDFISLDCDVFSYFRFLTPLLCKRQQQVRFFMQRMGIPMGGNTSNLYADLYMGFHLGVIMNELRSMGVLLVKKYVDDLLMYAPASRVNEIVALISASTKLEYTIELPVDGCLPYLDVLLVDQGGQLTTTW